MSYNIPSAGLGEVLPARVARGVVLGGAIGAATYWAWLLPLLSAAGGPITAGPASVVFGAYALGWNATMGTTAFASLGSVLGFTGGGVAEIIAWFSHDPEFAQLMTELRDEDASPENVIAAVEEYSRRRNS